MYSETDRADRETIQHEAKLKAEAAEMGARVDQGRPDQYSTGSIRGLNDTDAPCRVGLRERVSMDLHRADRESRRLHRLLELSKLLDKNPDVARILDLVEEVRG